jgi:hypothetical protein
MYDYSLVPISSMSNDIHSLKLSWVIFCLALLYDTNHSNNILWNQSSLEIR